MSYSELDRRDFSRLTTAVVGGLFSGASAIAQTPPAPIEPPDVVPPPSPPRSSEPAEAKEPQAPNDASAKQSLADKDGTKAGEKSAPGKKKPEEEKPKEIHICRGLNSCKDMGASGTNKCAGQGTCATTVSSPHECSTGNACRGQGGCGKFAGENQCAGYGDGAVPLTEEDWPRLRRKFEVKRKRLGLEFGPAPLSRLEMESDRRKAEADAKWLAEIEAKKKAEAAKNGNKGQNPKAANKDEGKSALDELTGDKDRAKPNDEKPPK